IDRLAAARVRFFGGELDPSVAGVDDVVLLARLELADRDVAGALRVFDLVAGLQAMVHAHEDGVGLVVDDVDLRRADADRAVGHAGPYRQAVGDDRRAVVDGRGVGDLREDHRHADADAGAVLARRGGAISGRHRVGVVVRLHGDALRRRNRHARRNQRLAVGNRHGNAGRAGDLHRAARAVGFLAVGLAGGALIGARARSALVRSVGLVMDLVVDATALVLAVLGLVRVRVLVAVAAGDARLGARLVGRGHARGELHRAARIDVALGRGERTVGRDGEREGNADAGVARCGISRRFSHGRAGVRGIDLEVAAELELVAVVLEHARDGLVVRDRHGNDGRDCGLALGAAGRF